MLTNNLGFLFAVFLVSFTDAKRKCIPRPTPTPTPEYSVSSTAPPEYSVSSTVPASAVASPSGTPSSSQDIPRKITILHTNDIHAHMEEFNRGGNGCKPQEIADNQCFGGVARIKTVVDEFRANTSHVVLLDAGDQFQGTLFFNYYGGNVSAHAMNVLKYDAMTIGNHEFDRGIDTLAQFVEMLDFPVISANIKVDDTETMPLYRAGVKPYMILPQYKLGIIGFITNTTASIVTIGEKIKQDILDPVTAVQKNVDELHAQGIHRIICLSHNGYKDDVYLAENVQGVQLIVGGHSHSLLLKNQSIKGVEGPYPTQTKSGLDGKPVYIVQAHRYGDYLGHLDLEWDDKDDLVNIQGDPILLDQSIPKDAFLNETIVGFGQVFDKLVHDALTTSTGDFPSTCFTSECPMGDLITDCMISEQAQSTKPVEISLVNSGGIRANFLKGQVTYSDVMGALPFGNSVASFSYPGSKVLQLLEHIADNMSTDRQVANMVTLPQFGGIRWAFNSSLPFGARVINATVGSEQLDPTREYQVSTIDFLLGGGDNIFPKFEQMPPIGDTLADLVASCLRKKTSISPITDGRTAILN